MTTSTDTLERLLVQDLDRLGERLADERLCTDVYRALTNRALFRRDRETEGHLSLSWGRAEEVLNTARAGQALAPLEGLAGSGAEGEPAGRAAGVLEEIGWDARPLNTGRHDDRHASEPAQPPPGDHGAPGWERQAHEDADATRHTRYGA